MLLKRRVINTFNRALGIRNNSDEELKSLGISLHGDESRVITQSVWTKKWDTDIKGLLKDKKL